MPKIHNIGKQHFVQVLTNFRVVWGKKVVVRGYTNEIDYPFRHSSPLIVRLPFHKALVLGKWAGHYTDEKTALNAAIHGRVLTDEDFEEGWTAPAYRNSEKSS